MLESEALTLANEVGPENLQLWIRERSLEAIRGTYRLREEGIIKRMRTAGFLVSRRDLSIRIDFEGEGMVFAVHLNRPGSDNTLSIRAATHGNPTGRPLPEASWEAVLRTKGAGLAPTIQTAGMVLLALWIFPPLIRRKRS
jgi:hypothetical protein